MTRLASLADKINFSRLIEINHVGHRIRHPLLTAGAKPMTIDDKVYFHRRADQARQASQRASDPRVKQAHQEMADLFECRSHNSEPLRLIAAKSALPL